MDTEARELLLFAENDGGLYASHIVAVIQNLKRKIAKGVYDPEKALTLWKYVADDAAQRYTKEFGGNGHGSYGVFDVATRKQVAKGLAEFYDEELKFDPLKNPRRRKRKLSRKSRAGTGMRQMLTWLTSSVKRGEITPAQAKKVLRDFSADVKRSTRRNPKKRHPLAPSQLRCVIVGVNCDRRDIGFFDGERLQPDPKKALLYASSLVARKVAHGLKRPQGVTYFISPAQWTKEHILNEACGTRKNPTARRGLAQNAEINAAARRLEAFTGHKARTAVRVKRPQTGVGFALGPVSDITYIAKRDGETAQYHHTFKPKSRPSLVASSDGTHLEIVGGRFRVTARGIVDY